MSVKFDTFRLLCPYSIYAFAYRDDHTRMEPVCRRPDRIPDGHSWGKCDEAHCPHFGIPITGKNVMMHDSRGAKLGECGDLELMAVQEPEDYE